MKVLHVIPSVGPLRGGPSAAMLSTCRALAQAGVEVTLVTSDDNGPGHLAVPLGVPVEQDGYTVLYFRRTLRPYAFCWGITPWLARHIREFDIVHIHAAFSYIAVIAGVLANLRRVPYVERPAGILLTWGVQARRTSAKQVHYQLFEKHILNRAAFVQAMSQVEAGELARLGITAPIGVIYHGLELPHLAEIPGLPTDTPDQPIPLLFIGRFHAVKGLDWLLLAFAQAVAQEPRLCLRLAGDGDEAYKTWLKNRIAELGLDSHVEWLGFLQGDRKWPVMASSAAVVMPSYSENFGLVAVEAMAAGTPIIVSDGVAIHGVVSESGAGRVVPVGDGDALAAALVELACDPDLRRRMGAAGRAAAAQFAPETVTRLLCAVYHQIIGKT